jgi:hypothetical protein
MSKKKDDQAQIIQELKNDLHQLNEDWQKLQKHHNVVNNQHFLRKMADDIQKVTNDAAVVEECDGCEDLALSLTYLLNTPWGAPFVGETTLAEAAEHFRDQEYQQSSLFHLMSGFAEYSDKFENQIIRAFEDIEKKMP